VVWAVYLRSPGAFDDLRVQDFLPAVEALHIRPPREILSCTFDQLGQPPRVEECSDAQVEGTECPPVHSRLLAQLCYILWSQGQLKIRRHIGH